MSNNSDSTTREPAEYDAEVAFGEVVGGANDVAKPGQERAGQQQPQRSAVVMAGVVEDDRARRIAKTYQRREAYRVTALVTVSLVLASCLASIAISVVVLNDSVHFLMVGSDSPFLYAIVSFILYILVIVESVCSMITAIVLIVRTSRCPESVLLRAPYEQGSFVCLCCSVVLLMLFAVYSFAVPIICTTTKQYPKEPTALCVVPAVRIVAYIVFFSVLIANRRLR